MAELPPASRSPTRPPNPYSDGLSAGGDRSPAAVARAPGAHTLADAVTRPVSAPVHLAADPGAPNLAAVGWAGRPGDPIRITEAMKVMNPITAPAAGTLKAVHVENSQPVEFDQPLFTIG
ncbi:MAG: acetyl-CoA carboxylase, biotin carboxyl carrier protein [Sphingopyxis sp.]|nr:acetyl-CoA carboxylase, biotin carboxyl carrier protein [Sphingopyxis sp.]